METEPEKVEVKRITPRKPVRTRPTLAERFNNALVPLVGGMILDTADLMTFSLYGLYFGFFVGAAIGWWIGTVYRFSQRAKIICAIVAGIYCLMPTTEFFPLATIIAAFARFFENPYKSPAEPHASNSPGEKK